MASEVVSKLYDFWQARTTPTYTRTPTQDQENDPSTTRASFEESLPQPGDERLTSWPNLSIDDSYRTQNEHRQSAESSGATSTTELFYLTRTPAQRNSEFFYRINLMCTRFPFRDMSYLVGVSFTIGSVFFVLNGVFLLLALIESDADSQSETQFLTPASSVIGTLIFLIGAWIGVLEALNLTRGEPTVTQWISFEASLEAISKNKHIEDRTVQISSQDQSSDSSSSQAPSSSQRPTVTTQSTNSHPTERSNISPLQATQQPALLGSQNFIYYPKTQHLLSISSHSLLFPASLIQVLGVLIFSLSTITSLFPILPANALLANLLNLLPLTLGGLLFLLTSLLQILHSQSKWYKPEPWRWDWWVGVWNAIGSLGFTLAGLLPWIGGRSGSEKGWGVVWGVFASLGGSWAFVFGGLTQWWGVLGRY